MVTLSASCGSGVEISDEGGLTDDCASGYLPWMILTGFLQVADAESLEDSRELVVAIEYGSR